TALGANPIAVLRGVGRGGGLSMAGAERTCLHTGESTVAELGDGIVFCSGFDGLIGVAEVAGSGALSHKHGLGAAAEGDRGTGLADGTTGVEAGGSNGGDDGTSRGGVTRNGDGAGA
ncbi:unnamed protein product, partial [Discosporangium mesarthrocarpum]